MSNLISCIMPTRNRRNWVPLALRCWQIQDYPAHLRELIVIADGEPVGDLMQDMPGVRSIHLAGRHSIGAKLNMAIAMAKGDAIAIWNDDDWHAGWRLSYQYAELERSQGRICGTDRITYLDLPRGEVWRYEFASQPSQSYLVGGTMMFRKEYWQQRPFQDMSEGEDTAFIDGRSLGMVNLEDDSFYLATIHEHNTSPKSLDMRHLSDNWRFLAMDWNEDNRYAAPWWLQAVRSLASSVSYE